MICRDAAYSPPADSSLDTGAQRRAPLVEALKCQGLGSLHRLASETQIDAITRAARELFECSLLCKEGFH